MRNLAKIGSGEGENCTMLPIGSIIMFGGVNIPDGWLLCDESTYDIATYPELAAALGGNFEFGETQFFTPDLRGRSPLGYGAGSGLTERDEMGARYGAETHALSIEELPSHNHFDAGHDHDIAAHSHPTQNHSHTQEAHSHTQEAHVQTVAVKLNATSFGSSAIATSSETTNATRNTSSATPTINSATPTINSANVTVDAVPLTTELGEATIENTGGNEAHNNLHPVTIVNFIIRAL